MFKAYYIKCDEEVNEIQIQNPHRVRGLRHFIHSYVHYFDLIWGKKEKHNNRNDFNPNFSNSSMETGSDINSTSKTCCEIK